jgi:hypothetical protein
MVAVRNPADRSKAMLIVIDVESGMSLRASCQRHKVPPCSFIRWTREDDELMKQYAKARDISLDLMAEEVIGIADAAEDANKARLQVDTRKWYMSKLAPKRYGDKLAVTGGDESDQPLRMEHSVGGEAAMLVSELLKGIKNAE